MSEHRWFYCEMCECHAVLCGTCGNNTCNGGTGQVDGKPCADCEDAFRLWQTSDGPTA